MLRSRSGLLALSLAFAAVFALGAGGVSDADARAKKKPVAAKKVTKKEPKVTPPNAEQKKALGELMGAFKFGMSKDEVVATVAKQVEERYAEQLKATGDIYVQDKLRKEQNKEITRFKQSFVEFKGAKTGWDVSLIDEEFRHNTGETMLVYWENAGGKNQRRFFFFFEGKLWKMFIAIDTKSLADNQRNFDFFRGLMEAKYGKGKIEPARETWKTPAFEVQAVDKMAFYGAFGLMIQQPSAVKQVAEARASNAPPPPKKDGMIEIIKQKDNDKVGLDENKGAVDDLIKDSKLPPPKSPKQQ